MDRKEFFAEALQLAFGKKKPSHNGVGVTRPPGALPDEDQFLKKCIGCDTCMAACPVHAIVIDDLERRDPIIIASQNPCIHCPGYPCIQVCPTGALTNQLSLRSVE